METTLARSGNLLIGKEAPMQSATVDWSCQALTLSQGSHISSNSDNTAVHRCMWGNSTSKHWWYLKDHNKMKMKMKRWWWKQLNFWFEVSLHSLVPPLQRWQNEMIRPEKEIRGWLNWKWMSGEWNKTHRFILSINFDVGESFSDPLATLFNFISLRNCGFF